MCPPSLVPDAAPVVETVPNADPFAPLNPETLREIAGTGVVRAFPRNAIIINEGEHGDSLFIVMTGKVKVFSTNDAGREFVIDFHGPGEYVGEMTLDGEPRSASVMTVEPTTCAVVNRAHFREFLLAHPDFALHLIERLIGRVRITTGNLKSLALSDVYGRLVRLINTLAREVDGKMVVRERLTQQEIADRIGASRDMIGKLMKDLVAGGYLSVEDRVITVHKKLPTGW